MKNKDKHNYKTKYKSYEIASLVGMILIMILISTRVHRKTPLKVADPVEQTHSDRNTANLVNLTGVQLIPGESVGRIELGESGEYLPKVLGKPQQGDAAMCKSWSRWEWGDPLHVLEVFESCDPKQDMNMTVQQIRFSGMPFKTQGGISPESTYAKIRQNYMGLTAAATFKEKATGRQMIIMDQVNQGIAFVVDAKKNKPDPEGKCHMIIIHPPHEKAIDTYLQPEWDLHPLK